LESGFKVFESSTWRPTGSTSSLWANKKSKPRMGLYKAARKNVTKNLRSPNDRRRRMVPHVGIYLPAPESCGPGGCAFEWCGRTKHTAPVSTMNCCLLLSSCKKIMPPPRVFSSRLPTRFQGPTGNQACTSSPVHRGWCGSSRCRCHLCMARGSSGSCAPGRNGGVSREASSPRGGRRRQC
jgi:hypothetical protein